MGGTSQTSQRQTSETRPWDMFTPELTGLKGLLNPMISNAGLSSEESGALAGLKSNAAAGNPFAPQIGGVTNQLLSGGTDRTGMVSTNLSDYRTALQPYTTGSTNPYDNADFRRILDDTTSRTMDAVKSSYTGAGIPAAAYGDFGKTAGEGITRAIAPLAYQAGNDLETRKRSAIDSLYGASNTSAGLLSGLDQTALGNKTAGVGMAPTALSAADYPFQRLLDLAGQQYGIPAQRTAGLAGLLGPLSALGSSSTGTGSGTQQMSGAQQFALIAGGLGSLFGRPPPSAGQIAAA